MRNNNSIRLKKFSFPAPVKQRCLLAIRIIVIFNIVFLFCHICQVYPETGYYYNVSDARQIVAKWPLQSRQAITIRGTLIFFRPPVATIKTEKNQFYLRVGPWWFWQESGYILKPGENIEVQGYFWNNYIVPVVIRTATQVIILRDQYGFPVWRGRMGRGRCWRRFWPGSGPGNQPVPGQGHIQHHGR